MEPAPAAPAKVPLKIKLSYVAVNFTLELQATIWALFALHFMTNNAKMTPSSAGWVAGLYRVWDALNDPVIGTLSDKTESKRWGRRRGWMLAGIFPFALAYFVMWFVPFKPDNQAGLFIYFLIVKMTSDLGYTCVNVPHFAILNDIAPDYHERFQINSLRTIGIAAGSLLSMALTVVMTLIFKEDETSMFLTMAGITCTFSVMSVCNCVYQTRHYTGVRTTKNNEKSLGLIARFKKVYSVKAAVLAIGMFVTSTSATQSTLAIATYYMKDYLHFDTLHLASVIITAQVVGIATAATVAAIQKRVEKRLIFFGGVSIWLMFYMGVSFLSPQLQWPIYVLAVIMGIGMATAMLIPTGFVSDSCEFVDYETGLRLEGTVFGSLHLINKSTVGLVVFAFEHILGATGFVPYDPKKPDVFLAPSAILGLRLCFSLIPATLLILAMILNYFIPINKETSLKVAEAVKERNDASSLLKKVEVTKEAQPPYVTFFLVDGLDRYVFKKLMNEGKLPNVAKLIREGSMVQNGVTSFPSITGFAFYPYITGEDACKSGIMGLRWFNRSETEGRAGIRNYVGKTNIWMNKDFNGDLPTIYERFSENHSYSTQCYANRGVKTSVILGWPMVSAKFRALFPFNFLKHLPFVGSKIIHTWRSYETLIFDKAIEDLVNKPKVQWLTLASTDSCHHVEGASKDYVECVEVIDENIGKYMKACKDLGMDKDRIYVFLSDHGVNDVHTNVDVGIQLSQKYGFQLLNSNKSNVVKTTLDDSLIPYKNFDLIACVNGNAMVYLYFKNQVETAGYGWAEALPYDQLFKYNFGGKNINLVKDTLNIDGVDLVFTRGPNGTSEIHSKEGSARVSMNGDKYIYEVIKGSDPFDYPAELHNQYLGAENWLNATYQSKYPYGPVRAHRMMSTSEAGDLMLISKIGYDFGLQNEPVVGNYKGAHGSLCADQMIVPFILKGPGIRAGATVTTATAEDLGATVLEALGIQTSATGLPIREILDTTTMIRSSDSDVAPSVRLDELEESDSFSPVENLNFAHESEEAAAQRRRLQITREMSR
eukprot:TRINITY_DN4655_c0_g1_i1.p1 TRINITY_DN4655_c0_g1~~TRINITY_DN4655_c0_g1_i1.p1  ORF type:complete len:1050 (-),score=275.70 TRINITY_DN4655_c0_g1_i1:2220-5369(-)